MERITIQKDCLLCDVCNKQLTDDKFIALQTMSWYEGWLYCDECNDKYSDATKKMYLIQYIVKGMNLSGTDLAKPMIMESW